MNLNQDQLTDVQKQQIKDMLDDKIKTSMGMEGETAFIVDWIYGLAVEQNLCTDELVGQFEGILVSTDSGAINHNKEVADYLVNVIAPAIKGSPEILEKKTLEIPQKKSPIDSRITKTRDDANPNKRDSKLQQKKIIHLERDIKPQESSNKQGDVFDRISKKTEATDVLKKKRAFRDLQNNNDARTNLNHDLKTLIDKDNYQHQKKKFQPINDKRIQKPEKYQKTQIDLRQEASKPDLTFQKSELGGQSDIMNRMKRFENAGGKEMREKPQQKKIIDLKKEIGKENNINPENPKKKLVKCKHFPNCKLNADDCPFFHPTEQCKYFPACTNGDKCIYLHPEIECKFGVSCSRQNCAYKHPKGRQAASINPMSNQGMMQAMMLMMAGGGNMQKHRQFNKKPYQGKKPNPQNGDAAQSQPSDQTQKIQN